MTTSTTTLPESARKADLHNWIKHQYIAKKLADLKKHHDAIWEAAEPTLAKDLGRTCGYLLEQQEKAQAVKVYITFRLQCQANVIIEGGIHQRSYDPYEGKTEEYVTFEEAWAEFENFVKHRYIQVTPSKDWEDWIHSTFDHPAHGNGKFPFESKMPDSFYESKDYKYDCYLEYETHITEIA